MRLIDAEAKGLLMELFTYRRYTGIDEAPIETAIDVIQQAPTIDAVPVVRCKDCRFSETYQIDSSGAMALYCKAFTLERMVADDDYCSYGKREDGEA